MPAFFFLVKPYNGAKHCDGRILLKGGSMDTFGVLPFTLVSGVVLILSFVATVLCLAGFVYVLYQNNTLSIFFLVPLLVLAAIAFILVGTLAFVAFFTGLTGLMVILLLSDPILFVVSLAVISIIGAVSVPVAPSVAAYVVAFIFMARR